MHNLWWKQTPIVEGAEILFHRPLRQHTRRVYNPLMLVLDEQRDVDACVGCWLWLYYTEIDGAFQAMCSVFTAHWLFINII